MIQVLLWTLECLRSSILVRPSLCFINSHGRLYDLDRLEGLRTTNDLLTCDMRQAGGGVGSARRGGGGSGAQAGGPRAAAREGAAGRSACPGGVQRVEPRGRGGAGAGRWVAGGRVLCALAPPCSCCVCLLRVPLLCVPALALRVPAARAVAVRVPYCAASCWARGVLVQHSSRSCVPRSLTSSTSRGAPACAVHACVVHACVVRATV